MTETVDKIMYQASAEILLIGDTLAPKNITAQVGLVPIRAWPKGFRYASRSGQELARHTGLWAFGYAGEEVASLVVALLASVEPRLEALRAAAQLASAEVAISIWWHPIVTQSGFGLESSLLTRLGAIAHRWSFYYPGVRLSESTGSELTQPASEAIRKRVSSLDGRSPTTWSLSEPP